MSRVLVLGAGGPAGENFTRAVRAGGHWVLGCDIDRWGLQLSSADARALVLTDVDTKTGRAARVAELNALIREHRIDVVHAQPDAEVAFLSANAAALEARALVPRPSSLAITTDKLLTARRIGPDAPRSVEVNEGSAAAALMLFGYSMWMRARVGAGSRAALSVDDVDVARAWCRYWNRLGVHLMAAPVLPGRILSWTGIYREGVVVASATKQRIALMGTEASPALISSTARVQRIVRRPDVASVARGAVSAIDPDADGVWMVDLRETLDGRPLVTEINAGRFGTTSEFFAQAGGNLPAVLVDLAAGEVPAERGEDLCRIGATQVRGTDMRPRLVADEVPA